MNTLKSWFDWFMVFVLYVVLRSRWIYFHINPRYQKFKMSEKESHFIHDVYGTLHSDIIIELKNGKSIRWWVYTKEKAAST
jgi:hypothetical protein